MVGRCANGSDCTGLVLPSILGGGPALSNASAISMAMSAHRRSSEFVLPPAGRGSALQQLHGDKRSPAVLAHLVNGADVGVIQKVPSDRPALIGGQPDAITFQTAASFLFRRVLLSRGSAALGAAGRKVPFVCRRKKMVCQWSGRKAICPSPAPGRPCAGNAQRFQSRSPRRAPTHGRR